jgi:cytochrome c oxidase subunit 2
VKIFLQSADVIHSFWVPNLHGKRDLIPNHATEIWLQADKPGTYNGQCAEFCGYEHAKMRLTVTAEKPAEFEAWLFAARQIPPEPSTEILKRGKQVFLSSQCVMCHTITGTRAGGRLGPDLTHVGSRRTLAAGSLPNMPGHLAGWIIDPQQIKPGARMPQNNIKPQDLRALLEYLESLK